MEVQQDPMGHAERTLHACPELGGPQHMGVSQGLFP